MSIPDLVILGAAGSGKGTQSVLLEEQFGYQRVEAGAIVRAKAKEDSELGRQLKQISESGGHAPEHVVSDLLVEFMKGQPQNKPLLFDGYPRSQGQADDLEKIMAKAGRDIKNMRVIWLNVGLEEAKRRLLNRAQCSKCQALYTNRDIKKCARCGGEITIRKDDNPEGIAKRLAYFVTATMDVIERYRGQGILIEINGEQPVVHVFDEIVKKIGKPHEVVYDSD